MNYETLMQEARAARSVAEGERTAGQKAILLLANVVDVLWREGDPEHEWDGDTLEYVAEELATVRPGGAPDEPPPEAPAPAEAPQPPSAGPPDVLGVLYSAANDYETAVLDELTEKAGLIWTCAACRWRNPSGLDACEHCKRGRASGSGEPAEPEWLQEMRAEQKRMAKSEAGRALTPFGFKPEHLGGSPDFVLFQRPVAGGELDARQAITPAVGEDGPHTLSEPVELWEYLTERDNGKPVAVFETLAQLVEKLKAGEEI